MHAIYADPHQRAQLWALLEAVWPGLPARFDAADWHGWPLGAVSTPFVDRAGGVIVSHVGVLEIPARLGGEDRSIAGLHGVCTHPEARRRGHFRAAMEQAMARVAERYDCAKLCTDKPWAYEPFGFRTVPQHCSRLQRGGAGGGDARSIAEAELPWLRRQLAQRAPVSERFAAREPGWLLGIDAVLWTGDLRLFQRIEALDCAVIWEIEGRSLQLYQLIARELPPLDAVLAHCPWPFDELLLWFGPDLLAPGAEALPFDDDEVLMVWGDWPQLEPFCLPPLERH